MAKESAARAASTKGINVFGYHTGVFGVAKTAVAFSLAMRASHVQVNQILLAGSESHKHVPPRERGFALDKEAEHFVSIFFANADTTEAVRGQVTTTLWRLRYNIGFWEWELDIFPEEWMSYLPHFDEIWVPSTFIADALMRSQGYKGTPVKVLPVPLLHAKQPANEFKAMEKLQALFKDTFLFLVTFDFLSVLERKNPYAALRAFQEAFVNDENVRLVIKSVNGHHFPKTLDKLQHDAFSDGRITLISEHLSDMEMNWLQSQVNCYVSLHRSEGYGLNILESLSLGIPVIATAYGGNTDFFKQISHINSKCHFPIPYELIEVGPHAKPYPSTAKWAQPSHAAAVEAMRKVYELKCFAVQEAQHILQAFSSEAIAKRANILLQDSMGKIWQKKTETDKYHSW